MLLYQDPTTGQHLRLRTECARKCMSFASSDVFQEHLTRLVETERQQIKSADAFTQAERCLRAAGSSNVFAFFFRLLRKDHLFKVLNFLRLEEDELQGGERNKSFLINQGKLANFVQDVRT